jgi:hypothetical protein
MRLPPNWNFGAKGFEEEFGYAPSYVQIELSKLVGWESVFTEHRQFHNPHKEKLERWLKDERKKKLEKDRYEELLAKRNGVPYEELEWCYVLENPSFQKNHYKVGWTAREPEARAEELSKMTSLPADFIVVARIATIDGPQLEARVHRRLRKYRREGKEFFVCPLTEIEQTLKEEERNVVEKKVRSKQEQTV